MNITTSNKILTSEEATTGLYLDMGSKMLVVKLHGNGIWVSLDGTQNMTPKLVCRAYVNGDNMSEEKEIPICSASPENEKYLWIQLETARFERNQARNCLNIQTIALQQLREEIVNLVPPADNIMLSIIDRALAPIVEPMPLDGAWLCSPCSHWNPQKSKMCVLCGGSKQTAEYSCEICGRKPHQLEDGNWLSRLNRGETPSKWVCQDHRGNLLY